MYETQEEAFKSYMPDNLYDNHYELHNKYPEWTPEEWRRFLKDNERFILAETTAMADADARKALKAMGSGNLKSAQVSSFRQLLDRSEQLQSQSKDQRTFVMVQFDMEEQPFVNPIDENFKNVQKVYGTATPEADYISINSDGTLYFHHYDRLTPLDEAYIRLFNPENKRVTEPIKVERDFQ